MSKRNHTDRKLHDENEEERDICTGMPARILSDYEGSLSKKEPVKYFKNEPKNGMLPLVF